MTEARRLLEEWLAEMTALREFQSRLPLALQQELNVELKTRAYLAQP